MRTTLILADDHPLMLDALERLFAAPAYAILATCRSGAAAMPLIEDMVPRVSLLDVNMPGFSGLDVLKTVARKRLHTRVILLTGSITGALFSDAMKYGCWALLLKDGSPEDLRATVDAVAASEHWSPARLRPPSRPQPPSNDFEADLEADALTAKEYEVARLASRGLPNKAIAQEMDVSEGTVKIHLNRIFRKTRLRNRTELAISLHHVR
ncbi:response regulator [Methylocystis parvus]|nr:response regulator transcription factor [Methylocystis parvus]WBK00587.1 response regulator transcription factor [Methylocystis parvus OBBP]